MSERIFRMTAIFETEDMAKSVKACLAPLNDEEYQQVDSCIKERGGKVVFSKM